MSEETIRTFTDILESVPLWLADLELILKSANARQTELSTEFRQRKGTHATSAEVSTSARSVSETPGRTIDLDETRQRTDIIADPRLQSSASTLASVDTIRNTQRKRKVRSDASSRSGPPKARLRSSRAVFYDGDAQKGLEKVIRNIGVCRNGLRKGKMAARIDSLTTSDSTSSSEDTGSGEECDVVNKTKLNYTRTRESGPSTSLFGNPQDTAVFDIVDKCLETSQTMCEKAAHQLLREGECQDQIKAAKDRFIEARALVETEMPRLKKKSERMTRRLKREAAKNETAGTESRKSLDVNALHVPIRTTPQLEPCSPFVDNVLEVDLECECDDDSNSDELFRAEIMQFPMGKFSRMRGQNMGTRLPT